MLEKIEEGSWRKEHICRDPEHNPPGHIVLEDGDYRYTCPSCGKVTTFVVSNPVL